MTTVFNLVLKRITKQKLTLLLITIFPLVVLVIPKPADFETPLISYGLIGLVLFFSAFLFSKQIIDDRQYKTIVRIAASPLSHRDYLLGHMLAYLVILMLQTTVFSFLGYFRWQGEVSFYLYGYVSLFFFNIMAISFSLFWHTFFKRYGTSIAIFSIAVNVMSLLGGLSFPLRFIPDNIKIISLVLPTYWYAYSLEEITNKDYFNAMMALLILLGFAIIFLTIGSKRRFE